MLTGLSLFDGRCIASASKRISPFLGGFIPKMKEKDDIPRIESGEKIKIDLDFEKAAIKKRRRYPFFAFLLFILLVIGALIVFELLDKRRDDSAEAILDVNLNEEIWQGAFDSEETFKACKDSFVSVIAAGRRSSGFVYSEDGWIVTVEGVVNEGIVGRIEVVLSDGRRFLVDFFRQNRESGLTLLKIEANGLCAARLNARDELCVGEEIFSFCAFDSSGEASLFSGRVAHKDRVVEALRADGGTRRLSLVQIGILLTEEGVGAPIFNGRGEVVGIACASGEAYGERYMVDHAFNIADVSRLLLVMKNGKRAGDTELFSIIIEEG